LGEKEKLGDTPKPLVLLQEGGLRPSALPH
jgi:hypothetical protein